jgi:hypothetical protein
MVASEILGLGTLIHQNVLNAIDKGMPLDTIKDLLSKYSNDAGDLFINKLLSPERVRTLHEKGLMGYFSDIVSNMGNSMDNARNLLNDGYFNLITSDSAVKYSKCVNVGVKGLLEIPADTLTAGFLANKLMCMIAIPVPLTLRSEASASIPAGGRRTPVRSVTPDEAGLLAASVGFKSIVDAPKNAVQQVTNFG